MRRGQEALIYTIPSHTGGRPKEKGVTISEFESALTELNRTGELTRAWFNENLKACAKEGACNFTSIGKPSFEALINQFRYAMLEKAVEEMQLLAADAVKTVKVVMLNSESDAARIKAAAMFFSILVGVAIPRQPTNDVDREGRLDV